MTTPTTDFFQELSRRGHETLLNRATGVIRFDITDDERPERWTVTLDHGDIHVSHKNVSADCRFRAPRVLFDQIAEGGVNPTAAMLRGAVQTEGDWRLLVLAQRLFRRVEKTEQAEETEQ